MSPYENFTRFYSIHFCLGINGYILCVMIHKKIWHFLVCSSSFDQWKMLTNSKEKVATGGISITNRKSFDICFYENVLFCSSSSLFLVKVAWHLITEFKINVTGFYQILSTFSEIFYFDDLLLAMFSYYIQVQSVLHISERRRLKKLVCLLERNSVCLTFRKFKYLCAWPKTRSFAW